MPLIPFIVIVSHLLRTMCRVSPYIYYYVSVTMNLNQSEKTVACYLYLMFINLNNQISLKSFFKSVATFIANASKIAIKNKLAIAIQKKASCYIDVK